MNGTEPKKIIMQCINYQPAIATSPEVYSNGCNI